MNLDDALRHTPESTDSWHCPWFKGIEFLAVNAVGFGVWADTPASYVAVAVGGGIGLYSLAKRKFGATAC